MLGAQDLTEQALALEYALYNQRIEVVCPLGTPFEADRWYEQRKAVIEARQAALAVQPKGAAK